MILKISKNPTIRVDKVIFADKYFERMFSLLRSILEAIRFRLFAVKCVVKDARDAQTKVHRDGTSNVP